MRIHRRTSAASSASRAAALGALALAAATFGGCRAEAVPRKPSPLKTAVKPVPPGGSLIEGAGATFPAALYDAWFRKYAADHPDRVVAYDAVGSGEGVRRFIGRDVADDERVDFGASDAAMRDDELAAVQSGAVLVPLTAGSVALAYNLPDVHPQLALSRQAYVGIFLGTVKTWRDPLIARSNPGVALPDLTITTAVRQDGSGTTFAFTKHLDAISEQWRDQYGPSTVVDWPGSAMRATGNEGVAGRIKQSIGSIGYVGYEFARKAGLQTARLENRAGRFVDPDPGNAASAFVDVPLPENLRLYVPDPPRDDAYPIVTLTWVLLYRHYGDPRKSAEIRDLFRWCLNDGQQYAGALGYAALPPGIVRQSLAALDRVQ
ncbi:MAG TPA: phosphate ABC transporter substrate-binding protein PstS [Vicinamibacterales bacterium]|nr:phosphate ABC transporter substrate-binding protein PstS [Vicinamibacterales bacterium]